MKKLKNPFLLAVFYGKSYFCDRKKELETMTEHFNNERNIVLYSWRRMGKTALIKYFLADQERNGTTEAIYVDLLGTRNMNAAVKQITQAVYDKFGKTSSGFSALFQNLLSSLGARVSYDPVSGTPEFSLYFGDSINHDKSLNAIGDFLQKRKKQITIALDEFQQVSHYSEENGEAHFRSWMQNFPGIRFIFSGSHRQLMLSMFAEKNRPFYRSAQIIHLEPIKIKEYSAFVKHHFKGHDKEIGQETIESLYHWARSQTYCVQLICNKLFGKYKKAELKHLEPVYKEMLEQESPVFSNYGNLLTGNQWHVLVAIAKEEPLLNPLSKDFIDKYQLGPVSTVSSVLQNLIKKEIIIKDEESFLVHDVLLARWLQRL